jgi:hypothetical protein
MDARAALAVWRVRPLSLARTAVGHRARFITERGLDRTERGTCSDTTHGDLLPAGNPRPRQPTDEILRRIGSLVNHAILPEPRDDGGNPLRPQRAVLARPRRASGADGLGHRPGAGATGSDTPRPTPSGSGSSASFSRPPSPPIPGPTPSKAGCSRDVWPPPVRPSAPCARWPSRSSPTGGSGRRFPRCPDAPRRGGGVRQRS